MSNVLEARLRTEMRRRIRAAQGNVKQVASDVGLTRHLVMAIAAEARVQDASLSAAWYALGLDKENSNGKG